MFMLRELKRSASLKDKVCNSLTKKEKLTMDIMLNKMQLPPGLITDEPWAAPWVEEEDGQLKEVCIQPSPAEAGIIVPYEKPKVPSTKKGGSASSSPPLPAIFASILGEATCEIKVSSVECRLRKLR